MADKRIIDFAVLNDAADDDLLLISSSSETYCITVGTLKETLHSYADELLFAVSNSLTYKGYVDFRTDLPSTGNVLGDVYTVRYQASSESGKTEVDGTEYVWSKKGSSNPAWIALGPSVTQKMDKLTNGKQGNLLTLGPAGNAADSGIALSSLLTQDMLGTTNGVASLSGKGKVPLSQLPDLGLLPQIIVTADIGCAVTCTNGSVQLSAQSQTGRVTFSIPSYGNWTLSGALLSNQATPVVIAVDTVKQYRVSLSFFAATLVVTGATADAKVYVGNEENVFSAEIGNGSPTSVTLTITAPGIYNIWETADNKSRVLGMINIENDGQRYTFAVNQSI